jgi:hypothetical protein
MRRSRRSLVVAVAAVAAVVLLGACSSGGGDDSSAADEWNEQRADKGFAAAGNREALDVLDRLAQAGITCTNPQEEVFNVLVVGYQKQGLPLPYGSASCEGPNGENLLVEVFRRDGYPSAADFMARKRDLVCERAFELGKTPNGPNDFAGLPYVIAKHEGWLIEPDSFAVNRQLAKALGVKSRDACAGLEPE